MRLFLDRSPATETGYREGKIARSIEQRTSRIPSDAFLWSALASMGVSLALMLRKRGGAANFIGQWAPTLLILGLYNKLVKLEGSDPKPAKRR